MADKIPKLWFYCSDSAMKIVTRGLSHFSNTSTPRLGHSIMMQWRKTNAAHSRVPALGFTRIEPLNCPLSDVPIINLSTPLLRSYSTNASSSGPVKQSKAKAEKVKEFKLKSTIGAHDLTVKLNQVQGLLTKGKKVAIIFTQAGNQGDFKSQATTFHKKISSDFESLCKVRQDYQNKTEEKFVLIPTLKDAEPTEES